MVLGDEKTVIHRVLRPEGCMLWQAQSSPQSSNMSCKTASVLTSPITKANSTSLLNLSRCHELPPESGSPLSQENSSVTVFQASALEPTSSLNDQSAFQSVLSGQSSTSLFEFDSVDGAPPKKRKVRYWLSTCQMTIQLALQPGRDWMQALYWLAYLLLDPTKP